jgi:hypothetical protein
MHTALENTDIITGGVIKPFELIIPAATIKNVGVASDAAIAASKSERSFPIVVSQAGPAVTATHLVRFCKGTTGTIKHVTVSNITACAGSSEVTVDVKKNGTTVLSAVVTLNSSKAAYSETEATITVPALADGEYLTVHITATQSGTDALATGVLVQIDIDEDYAA